MKKSVLENFTKFTSKNLWFAKIPKTSFLQNNSARLLLAFSCTVTVFLNFVSFFLVAAHKKDSFKLRVD